MTAFVTAWIIQNIRSMRFHSLWVRLFPASAKTQTTTEQNDNRTTATTVVLNHAVVLVWILPRFSRSGFVTSALPLTVEEEERKSFWRATKRRTTMNRRSTAEKRTRWGHGERKTNLSHWIATGREDVDSMTADEEHESLESHIEGEEENHHIFPDNNRERDSIHTTLVFTCLLYTHLWQQHIMQ